MDEGLLNQVKKRVDKQQPKNIVINLSKKGYEEEHIKKAIKLHNEEPKNTSVSSIILKEFSEKLGAGMSSLQYINILMSLLGASFFIVGIFTGIKSILDVFLSSFMHDFNSVRTLKRSSIIIFSFIFAIFFALIGAAVYFELLWLLILSMILASTGVVILGDTYMKLLKLNSRPEERGFFLSKISQFSLVFIVIGLITGAILLQKDYNIYALHTFFSVSILFLISGFFISRLYKPTDEIKLSLLGLFKRSLKNTSSHLTKLLKNKIIVVLFITTTITGVVQTLGNAYFGIFIFGEFKTIAFKSFLNVGVIFSIAVLTALVSPTIARLLSKKYGTIPQLVFGTLLIALLPLAYWFTPFLISISMATMIGIIGAAIVALASSILIKNELGDEEKKMFYISFPLLVIIPYIITIPLGSWLANIVGLKTFFLILALILIIIVAPAYFSLLFMVKRRVV